MLDVRDPGIKLFGKTIPLQQKIEDESLIHLDASKVATKAEVDDPPEGGPPCKQNISAAVNNGREDNYHSSSQNSHVSSHDKDVVDAESEEDKDKNDTPGEEKVLKKPDKVIPCPRCNSIETKFCYYNNYNVNQPRHFCKNCQRYWTAGGTMRNVPVGAGRRKNKHISSQYRNIMMSSDGITTAHVDTPDSAIHHDLSPTALSTTARPLNGNEALLKLCPKVPLIEAMTSALNLADQKKQVQIGAVVFGENGQQPSSCGSSMMTSACAEARIPENTKREEHCVSGSCAWPTPQPLHCYPGLPWAYPWNSGWNTVDPMATGRCSSELLYKSDNGNPKAVQWGSTPMMPAPAFCATSVPFQFVPATYWSWAAGEWNVPWVGSTGKPSPSSSTSNSGCSSHGSPTLGKHSRDSNLPVEDKSENCLWVPKTLRIDYPDEAAKSSIWATLGIKPSQNEPLTKGGIFKAFQPKSEITARQPNTTKAIHANPAALSRSQAFQEST